MVLSFTSNLIYAVLLLSSANLFALHILFLYSYHRLLFVFRQLLLAENVFAVKGRKYYRKLSERYRRRNIFYCFLDGITLFEKIKFLQRHFRLFLCCVERQIKRKRINKVWVKYSLNKKIRLQKHKNGASLVSCIPKIRGVCCLREVGNAKCCNLCSIFE